jgi:O-antigen/teichoic acid export membrane protein
MVGLQQLSSLINNTLKVVFQIGFIIAGFGFAGLAGGFILGILAAAICNWHFLTLGFARFTLGHIKSLYRFAFWLFLAGIATVLYANIDTLILTIFLSPSDIGIYRTVFQLTTLATIASTALYIVLFPKISFWYACGKKDVIGSALKTAFTYSLMLAVPVCVGGMVLSDRLLYFLYGPEFVKGTGALIILLVSQIFSVFMYLQIMCLNATNKPMESCKAMCIAIIINIFLDIVLIPHFGLVGAAIAAFFAVIVNVFISYKALSLYIHPGLDAKALRNILIASGVMGGALLYLRLFIPFFHVMILLTAVFFGALLYFVVLLKLDPSFRSELSNIAFQVGFRIP